MPFDVKDTSVDGLDPYLRLLVVGEPNAGKLEFTATFPNPLFITTHEGLPSLKDQKLPFITVRSIKDILDVRVILEHTDAHRNEFGFSPKTVVIDSINGVQRLFSRERLLKTRKDNMDGEDYSWLGDQMENLLVALRNLDMHVVFLTSQKDVNGIVKPALVGRTVDTIFECVDYAFHQRARVRIVVEHGEASSRVVRSLLTDPDLLHPWVNDLSDNLPTEFVLDFKNDFANLQSWILRGVGGSWSPEAPEDDVVSLLQELEEHYDADGFPLTDVVEVVETVSAGQEIEEERPSTTVVEQLLEEAAQPTKAEPVTIEGKYACEDCGVVFDDEDEADMGVIKFRVTVCGSCYDVRDKEK